MQALFVHGMGRTPLSGWRLLARLKAKGIAASSFGYAATFQNFIAIRTRLNRKIIALATHGDYVLIGHSLGGVLLRAAVASLPAGTRLPHRIFLLGSPVRVARIARKLQRNWIYRMLAGDCGQLLGSQARMADIGAHSTPTTSILGIAGWRGRFSLFGNEMNDGIVSVSEASAEWINERICLPAIHTYMPSNKRVFQIILERIASQGA
ncbi:MAG TPA: alpha/beta fold hydrolase [Thiobacillaceae bacterium]|nr:alpha/beta fold hydrolase [Thiobacillaceae bacterium]